MSDLIDRQALLRQIDIDSDGEPGYYGDTWKFIDTIERMPSALGTNLAEVGTDCISREQAIDALDRLRESTYSADYGIVDCDDAINTIAALPPTEPKMGRWIHDGSKWTNRWICSECGYKWFFDCIEGAFCPHCGAKMEVTDGRN